MLEHLQLIAVLDSAVRDCGYTSAQKRLFCSDVDILSGGFRDAAGSSRQQAAPPISPQ